MIAAGIDIGSSAAKAFILNDNEVLAWAVCKTRPGGTIGEEVLKLALDKVGLARNKIEYIVATGYGRVNVPIANRMVTEISCHTRGVIWLHPDIRFILDVGGQDSKAIQCSAEGKVIEFVMNDKCAAGTGRYLERLARTMDFHPEEIGPLSLELVEGPLPVNSFCVVFAQTDVLMLLRQGKSPNDIFAGACDAIVERLIAMLKKVGNINSPFAMTGGVAKNIGIVKRLEQAYGVKVIIPFEPQIIGALGAALFARERLLKEEASQKAGPI